MSARHLLLLASIACCGATHEALGEQGTSAATRRERTPAEASAAPVVLTPLVVRTGEEPIPVRGGDGRDHLVYELDLANFTGEKVRADRLRVVDAGNGEVLADLDGAQLAGRLVVRDRAATPGEFAASQLGILYLHVVVDPRRDVPLALEHRLSMSVGGATVSVAAARLHVRPQTALVLDAPLRGLQYIAGDGCCDSKRHIRATLSLNGNAYDAQRFAIDWEQLDSQGRIYVGDPKRPASYLIYGKPVYAVADARVAAAVDNMDDSPPGGLPNLPVDRADGNHVILDLGGGRFALYAHFKPQSLRVHDGQLVRRGELLGLVGTSGNSSEPHLHFQVMDAPASLRANGVPYLLRQFAASKRAVSTAAFDKATQDGQPIETVALKGAAEHRQQLPLDLWITDLP